MTNKNERTVAVSGGGDVIGQHTLRNNYLVVKLLFFFAIGFVAEANVVYCPSPSKCCRGSRNASDWCEGTSCCTSYNSSAWSTILSSIATVLLVGLVISCFCGLYVTNFGRTLKLKWINRHRDALRAAAAQDNATGTNGESRSNRRTRNGRRHRDVESADTPPPPTEIFPNDSAIFRPPDYDDLSITNSEPPKYEDLTMTSLSRTPSTVIGTTNPAFEPDPEEGPSTPVIHVMPLYDEIDDSPITMTTNGSEIVVRVDVVRPEVAEELPTTPPTYENAVTSSSP